MTKDLIEGEKSDRYRTSHAASAADDIAILQLVLLYNPFISQHGSKDIVWKEIAAAYNESLNQDSGNANSELLNSARCKNRVGLLVNKFLSGEIDHMRRNGPKKECEQRKKLLDQVAIMYKESRIMKKQSSKLLSSTLVSEDDETTEGRTFFTATDDVILLEIVAEYGQPLSIDHAKRVVNWDKALEAYKERVKLQNLPLPCSVTAKRCRERVITILRASKGLRRNGSKSQMAQRAELLLTLRGDSKEFSAEEQLHETLAPNHQFSSAQDIALLQSVLAHNPFLASHGSKLEAWHHVVKEFSAKLNIQNGEGNIILLKRCRDRAFHLVNIYRHGSINTIRRNGTQEEFLKRKMLLKKIILNSTDEIWKLENLPRAAALTRKFEAKALKKVGKNIDRLMKIKMEYMSKLEEMTKKFREERCKLRQERFEFERKRSSDEFKRFDIIVNKTIAKNITNYHRGSLNIGAYFVGQ